MMIRWIAFVSLCMVAWNVNALANIPEIQLPNAGEIIVWRGERWMLDCVNWHRQRAGLPPVVIDPEVQARCRAHCYWMAKAGSMTHSGRSGENIAAGQSNVLEAVNVWVGSPAHAVQIFDRNKTVIGVACYQSPGGGKFYCMEAH
jgi:uncharacterized protein YkwD